MSNLLKIFIILTALTTICVGPSIAKDGPIQKLSRGLTNTFTGLLEIPTTIEKSTDRHGYIGGFIHGIPAAAVKCLTRTSVGVYETLTFPLSHPNNYGPIIKPDFVEDSEFEKLRAD